MKKLSSFSTGKLFVCILVFFELIRFNVIAQTCVVAPTNSDNHWASLGSKLWAAATIDYTPNCSSCSPGTTALLTATVGGPSQVSDGVNTPISLTGLTAVPDDVIIGNDTNSTGDYILAAVSVSPLGVITLDIYNVVSPGTGSFAVNFNSSYTITSSAKRQPHVRIDGIAEYGNIFPTSSGLPLYNQFVISWVDASGLEAYYATLNSPGIGSTTNIVSSSTLGFSDVAAIQRNISGNVHNMTLFTYVDSATSPLSLKYVEWDITANTMSTPKTLGSFTGFDGAKIEAIDDYTINDPTIPSPLAYYCITANNSSSDILMYTNLSNAPTNLTHGTCLSGLTDNFPDISAGPDANYTIVYGAVPSTSEKSIAQIVDWSTGTASSSFYQVSTNTIESGNIPATVTSSSCNTEGSTQKTFVFYALSSSATDYKNTNYPYAFKPTSVPTTAAAQSWKVYPVPTSDYIQVAPPATLQYNDLQYQLLDLTGRVLQTGTITAASNTIGISSLPPGVCSIAVFQDGIKLYNQLVVIE